MKKVEFEQVKSQSYGFGMGKGMKYQFEDVEKIIEKRYEQGWEFCGYVPLTTRGTGDIETMSMIFQKEAE